MIRVGIGGWVFKPWRGEFYPEGLPQARELEYASRKLTAIEINGTFYSTQKPESFRKWAAETPDDFVFSLKAPRFTTHRRVLAEAGELDRAIFWQRRRGIEGKARADSLADFIPARNSSRTILPPFSRCCRSASTASPSATPSRSGTRAFCCRTSSRCCASTRWRRSWSNPTSIR